MSDMRDKIRKLLALAADASAGEAATAADMAARLMTEHGITLAEAAASAPREKPAIGVRRVEVSSAMWEAMLIHGVAEAMGGSTVRSQRGGGTAMIVYAPESLVDSVLDLAGYIKLQILREATREAHRSDTERVRAWKRSFILGAIVRVCDRLRQSRQQAVSDAMMHGHSAPGSALMALTANVKAKIREDFPHLRRSAVTRSSSGDGHRAGHAAGDRIDIGQRGISGQRGLPGR